MTDIRVDSFRPEVAALHIVLCLTVVTIVFIVGFAIGSIGTDAAVRREAIKAGVAEWQASEDGAAVFQWKQPSSLPTFVAD